METLVTPRCSGQPALTQPCAKPVNCYGNVFVSVCVDSGNDPGSGPSGWYLSQLPPRAQRN